MPTPLDHYLTEQGSDPRRTFQDFREQTGRNNAKKVSPIVAFGRRATCRPNRRVWLAWERQSVDSNARLASETLSRHLTEEMSAVSTHAQKIDNSFLFYESRLAALSGAASHALLHGVESPDPVYDAQTFLDPTAAPPDLAWSSAYGGLVSTDWPVYTVAPGIPSDSAQSALRLLNALRPQLQMLFLADHQGRQQADDARSQILEGRVPWTWAYVALQDTGLMYMYPGKAGWDEAYDPWTRPWYRDGVGTHAATWTTPYVDLMGQGRLLSCVQALYKPGGGTLGIAGIDLHFDDIIEEFLQAPEGVSGVERVSLLNGEGRVIIASEQLGRRARKPKTSRVDPGLELAIYPEARVVAAALEGRPGYVSGAEGFILFAPLQHLGWTFVVEQAVAD